MPYISCVAVYIRSSRLLQSHPHPLPPLPMGEGEINLVGVGLGFAESNTHARKNELPKGVIKNLLSRDNATALARCIS